MDDATERGAATPRYVPAETVAPRRGLPESDAEVPGTRDPEETTITRPRRAAVEPEPVEERRPDPAPAGRRPGYVIALAVFTLASTALVAWLVFGYAGGTTTWQMLVPLVPWALLVVGLWVQVVVRAVARRR